MTLLQVFFIISGIIILFIALDIAKKEKFNALHFLVFIFVGIGLLVFTFFPGFLNFLGGLFGLQRGADVLVYSSIIFLIYFSLLLLKKVEWNSDDLSKFVREIALENSSKKIIDSKVVFLVRVYNEAKVLETTIEEIINSGFGAVLVVNDGSVDNSRTLLEKFGDKIILINHLKNRGAGAALETGFEYIRRYSSVEYVCTFDSDGQHNIADFQGFLDEFEKDKDLDIVLGSRFIKKTNTNIGLVRKIVLKLGIIFTLFVSNIKLTDSHNGYRVFRKRALEYIRLTIDDMGYASELVDLIAGNNLKFREIPVNILYTEYSLAKGQKSSNAIKIALRFIWSKFIK